MLVFLWHPLKVRKMDGSVYLLKFMSAGNKDKDRLRNAVGAVSIDSALTEGAKQATAVLVR